MPNSEQTSNKMFDPKIPLQWILGLTCTIVFTCGGIYVKINEQASAISHIEDKLDRRDADIQSLTNNETKIDGELGVMAMRMTQAEKGIANLEVLNTQRNANTNEN